MVGECLKYRGDKISYHPRFRDVAESSLSEASTYIRRALVNCQENKLGPRSSLAELTCSLNSGEDWHSDVQYNHIWLKALCFADQGPSIINSADHFKVRLQQRENTVEHRMMVVSEKDSWPRQDRPLFLPELGGRTMHFHAPCFR